MGIYIYREAKTFANKPFSMFIYNKQLSDSGLHQHDYYEYTVVLTGRYYQYVNGKRVLLERGDFTFIPIGSQHKSSYDFGTTRILNVGIKKEYFERYFKALIPENFIASQAYSLNNEFLNYIESLLISPLFREENMTEFLDVLTFAAMDRIRHYKEPVVSEEVPQWLHDVVEAMHRRQYFAKNALAAMVALSGKSQEYLTRVMRRYYNKTPMQLINEIRINYAKLQLEVTQESIADIAFDSGYSDVSIFIKNFKKLTSFTPGSYRKTMFSKLSVSV
ncbi:MAG: transcriptional regulator ChbR [Vibrionaceae bacterium]